MTFNVVIGGEAIPFGFDDVVDYLKQYGNVLYPYEGNCWLTNTTEERFHTGNHARVYVWHHLDCWRFDVYGGRKRPDVFSRSFKAIDKAVALYLECQEGP